MNKNKIKEIEKKEWTLNQWQTSEDDLDRLVWFATIQSPHNLWRVRQAIGEALQQRDKEWVEKIKERKSFLQGCLREGSVELSHRLEELNLLQEMEEE